MNRFVAVLILVSNFSVFADEWGSGPIEIRNQFPLHRHHLSFYPTSPEIQSTEKIGISSSFITSNTSLLYDSYRVDSESRELNIGFNYGVSSDLELGVSSQLLWQGGGVLDGTIDSWHQFFHLPRGKRDRVPEDQFQISGETDTGSFAFDDHGTDLGLTTIYGKYLLYKGDANVPAVSFRVESLIPVSTVEEAPSNSDLSSGIILSKRFSSLIFYGGGAYLHYFDDESNSLRYKSGHGEGFLASEYEWNKDFSLHVGWILLQEPTANLAAGPSHTSYLDVGFKYLLSEDVALSVAVRENPGPRKLSSDITGYLGVTFNQHP